MNQVLVDCIRSTTPARTFFSTFTCCILMMLPNSIGKNIPGPDPVPQLRNSPSETVLEHRNDFSRPWRMQQAWRSVEEDGFEPATVSMAWQTDAIIIVALLPDREIYNSSTADDEYLYQLGDVFEVFIRRENSHQYLELHVSPNGHQTHLRWTKGDIDKVMEGRAEEDDFRDNARAFYSKVSQLPDDSGWGVVLQLPSKILPDATPFKEGETLAVSFSRYDADARGKNAILSSTSPHEKLAFHRWQEWRTVILK